MSDAQRMARHRQRRKQGMISVRIDVRASERVELVKHGFLAPGSEDDASAVRRAIHRLLDSVFPAKQAGS
jgi:hypothetical protein